MTRVRSGVIGIHDLRLTHSVHLAAIIIQIYLHHRGEKVCAPRSQEELCWRKHKLMVGPPMPDRSKRPRWSVVPGPPGRGLGVTLTTRPQKKITVTKPWTRRRPTKGCSTSTEDEDDLYHHNKVNLEEWIYFNQKKMNPMLQMLSHVWGLRFHCSKHLVCGLMSYCIVQPHSRLPSCCLSLWRWKQQVPPKRW
jgi:hypothetical protein